jgi:hypothetical protein
MSKIKIGTAKRSKLNINGGNKYTNAPKDFQPHATPEQKNEIYIRELENVTANLVGGHEVVFRESDLKSVLTTIERVVSNSGVAKQQSVELRDLLRQIGRTKLGGDTSAVKRLWERIVFIVHLTGLRPEFIKNLLEKSWLFIAKYFGIG